ncbi:Fis family transcriptional regulator [Alteromonas sp. ASW11-130]|uniref:Fis family transcriptional regulator n=1 Tax=Alteromonas sp. ASW11-130 TaxID=3015775 RepID=UPI0022419787|nr:Fis family transcriptional regulator [Alteromonas sp. ASW11-130]MCW8090745.1 Fis family transcriptional regulator [Alteromonas sp. ASW11-130]
MKKTIKKLDNNVIKALTAACETAKQWGIGFEWLTHTARYEHFPGSLMITCIFNTRAEMEYAVNNNFDRQLRQLIQTELLKAGIRVNDIRRHVRVDNEESCDMEDQGDWQARLTRWKG